MSRPEDRAKERQELAKHLRLGVLISNKGTGSNLKAMIDGEHTGEIPHASVGLVISDKEDAQGLDHAKRFGILNFIHPFIREKGMTKEQTQLLRDGYSTLLASYLNAMDIDVAVLAGFMTIISEPYFVHFNGVTINIHPGFIPDNEDTPGLYDPSESVTDENIIPWNRGLMTDNAVANFIGKPEAFSTIHVVTPTPDFGPVLERVSVPVQPHDTVDSLYGRLKLQEHEGLRKVINGERLRELVRAKKAA